MSDADLEQDVAARDPLVDRAVRLFEFLGRAQQLKAKPPRTVDTYQRDGSVLWLADLPDHPAVTAAHRGGDPDPDDSLLILDRVARLAPPPADEDLAAWLNGPWDDPERPPDLRETMRVHDEDAQSETDDRHWPFPTRLTSDEGHDVRERYELWLTRWQAWAARNWSTGRSVPCTASCSPPM